jgi:putative PEP-CTERM system histidine kinase
MIFDNAFISASLSFTAAAGALLLAGVAAMKDRRSLANRSFIVSLTLLGLIEIFRGLSRQGTTPGEMLYWQEVRIILFAFAPGTCLIFSLSFTRPNYREHIKKWKLIIAAVFALPISTVLLFRPVFETLPVEDPWAQTIIPLGLSGKIFYTLILVSAVLIITNLERTLRASMGRIRWQIKFILLGMGIICGGWIYTSSQTLIYSVLDVSLTILHPATLIVASLLFAWGLKRSQFLKVDVYLSHTTIQYSLTAILASIYLICMGLLVFVMRAFNLHRLLALDALLVLLALAVLGALLLSDRLQERVKRFITRHFERPLYDYRKAWMDLTEKTNSLVELKELCGAVARIVSQTFGILSVNVWLCDEAKEKLMLAGSTVFTRLQAEDLVRSGDAIMQLFNTIESRSSIIDLKEEPIIWAEDIMRDQPDYFAEYKMRYIFALRTGGQFVGIMTLNDDRVGRAALSLEDQDLLNAYAAQLAARVLQLRLSEKLRQSQEIEAFQNVSAFFVHDLKNLASRLSLTMQNLPAYFDNPEFRSDALKLIGESIAKIDSTCSRLSSFKEKIELRTIETDLNALVSKILEDFERSTRSRIEKTLAALPPVSIDPEQIQTVLTNLIMNAYDATKGRGGIRVATSTKDHQVILSISDNGCGMSRQFMERMLFRPFQSTKKRGMGIGLFHSKMIIEAHSGKIEVESEEGKGTTFRIILPVL